MVAWVSSARAPVLACGLLPRPPPVGLSRDVLHADGAPADVRQVRPLQGALRVFDRVILHIAKFNSL